MPLFELPTTATEKSKEKPTEKKPDPELFYKSVEEEHGQMAADIERALSQNNAFEYLNTNSPKILKELFDDAVSRLEIDPNLIPTVTRDVLEAIRSAARKGKFTYEDYSFDAIRKELQQKFKDSPILSVKEKKTAKDLD